MWFAACHGESAVKRVTRLAKSGRRDAAQESYAAVTVIVACMLGWIVHVIW
jgi:hypothetical protein